MSQANEVSGEEVLLLAEHLGDLQTRIDRLQGEHETNVKPMEAAAVALQAALAGVESLKFHVLDNDLGKLSARVEGYRTAIDEQIGVIVSELKKADDAQAAKTGATALALRDEIAAIRAEYQRVELSAKEELSRVVSQFAAIPGPKGEPGAAINPTGSYAADKAYNRLDLVSYMGGSYLSNEDDNKEKPGPKSKKWTQMAQRGGPGGGSGDITGLTGTLLPSQIASGTAAFAVGDILYANTTGTLTKLAAGTSGKLLSTQGAGAAPIWVAATGGAGDVNGPASATDNAIVRFDGTGGKTVQNSGVTIDDSGNLTVSGTTSTLSGNSTTSSVVQNASMGVGADQATYSFSDGGGAHRVQLSTGVISGGDGYLDIKQRSSGALTRLWRFDETGKLLVGSAGDTNLYRSAADTLKTDDSFIAGGNLTVSGTGTSSFAGAIVSQSATGGVGYTTGAGGTVTQATSKGTGVTLNKISGQITTHNAALAANTAIRFAVTNSAMAANDVVIVNHASGGTLGSYDVAADTNAAGSFAITLRNNTAGSLSEALVLSFVIIKGATS